MGWSNYGIWGNYGIKLRRAGKKQFEFLTPRGGTNRLRIHASRFTADAADRALAELRLLNPDIEFKRITFVHPPNEGELRS